MSKNTSVKTPIKKIKLLLVDDQVNNLIALEAVLSSPEYELISAHSGREALELVKVNEFALILMDVQMPDMDGFETVRRLKTMPEARDIPIIFITAVYSED